MHSSDQWKKLAAVMLAGSLTLAPLAACGSNAANTSTSEEQQSEATSKTEDDTTESDANAQTGVGSSSTEAGTTQATSYDAGGFTFDLPAYWEGRVEVQTSTSPQGQPMATITLPGNEAAVLATLTLCDDGEEPMIAGDIGNHLAGHVPSNGSRVEVWTHNWPWLVRNDAGMDGISEAEQRELVDLSTGGALSYDDVFSKSEDEINMVEADYTGSTLVPLVSIS